MDGEPRLGLFNDALRSFYPIPHYHSISINEEEAERRLLDSYDGSHHHHHHEPIHINNINNNSIRINPNYQEEEDNINDDEFNNRFFFFSLEDLAYYFLTLFFVLILSFYLFFFASLILEQVLKGQLSIELPFPILGKTRERHHHHQQQQYIINGDGPVTSVCNLDYHDSSVFLCSFISENEKPVNCHNISISHSNDPHIIPCILLNRDHNTPKIKQHYQIKLNNTSKKIRSIDNENQIKLSIVNHFANEQIDEESIMNHLVEYDSDHSIVVLIKKIDESSASSAVAAAAGSSSSPSSTNSIIEFVDPTYSIEPVVTTEAPPTLSIMLQT